MSESTILNMFPNEIKPCDGETKVKAYHCAELQSKFLGVVKAWGVLTITNKRVIFGTKGVKNDKNFCHSEVAIEDVAGVTLKNNKYFDIIKLLVTYLFVIPLFSVPFALLNLISSKISDIFTTIFKLDFNQSKMLSSVIDLLLLVGFIAFLIILARKNKQKLAKIGANGKNILQSILTFLSPFRPALTLKIISKGGEQGAINIALEKHAALIDFTPSPVPTEYAVSMTKEVGAIINDIQKLGDFGIDKWKNTHPTGAPLPPSMGG